MEELADAFAPLAAHDRLLLAVSGGADSLALMHLVHDWHNKQSHTISLHVATVNHDLRVEAADECCFVAEEARRLGIPHRTLVWSHSETEAGNIQAKARNARYELLADHAQSLGCKHVVTAHHLDDQAETFLMRLIRGSGCDRSWCHANRERQRVDHDIAATSVNPQVAIEGKPREQVIELD